MNEIERAIRELQLYVDVRWDRTNDMFNLALAALREQVERSKGCEHCRGWDSRCGANYCPMCGKELEVHNENT